MSGSPYVLQHHECDQSEETVYRVQTRSGERFDTVDLEPFQPEDEIEWLWPGRIALGKVTVLEGAPGAGKSRVAFDLAARVGGGQAWPDGAPAELPAADVLVISRHIEAGNALRSFQQPGKEPRQLVRFRGFWMESAAGQDCGDRPVAFPFDLEALEYHLECHPEIGMVIIDPLSDFCATPKRMAETLHRLNDIARRCRVALLVTVPAQCRFDARGALKVASRWPTDAARCAWCLVADPDDPSRRLLVARRINFCREPDGLAFRLNENGVAWEADSEIKPLDPLGQVSIGEKCLQELLSAGPLPATTIFRLGAEQGISQRELRSAARRIGAKTTRIGYGGNGHWEWSLAAEAPPTDGDDRRTIASAAVDPPPAPVQESSSPSPRAGEGPDFGEPQSNRTSVSSVESGQGASVSRLPGRASIAPDQSTFADGNQPESRPAGPVSPLSKRKAKQARRRLARQQAALLRKSAGVLVGTRGEPFDTDGSAAAAGREVSGGDEHAAGA